jgi:hypothetical protein
MGEQWAIGAGLRAQGSGLRAQSTGLRAQGQLKNVPYAVYSYVITML